MNRLLPHLLPRALTTRHDTLQNLYDSAATQWQDGLDKLGFGAAYDTLFAKAKAMGRLKTTGEILDAGCGTGAMARACA